MNKNFSPELIAAVEKLYNTGLSFSFVNVVEPSGEKAMKCFAKCSELDDGDGFFCMGQMFELGFLVDQDLERAKECFNQCARLRNPKGCVGLAESESDADTAKELYLSAYEGIFEQAGQNDAISQLILADYFERGLNGQQSNYNAAFYWMSESASRGCHEAQLKLGGYYEKGLGVDVDAEKAFKWYTISASQGNGEAQYNRAKCFDIGFGVEQDTSIAVRLYGEAAKMGVVKAMYRAGLCYEKGIGVEMEMARALEFYQMAAEQGNEKARKKLEVHQKIVSELVAEKNAQQTDLNEINDQTSVEEEITEDENSAESIFNKGYAFLMGNKTAQNFGKAAEMFERAAQLDYGEAQYQLALLYERGQGVEPNYSKAAALYEKAMLGGVEEARYALAECYEKGLGVPKDLAKASQIRGY